MDATPWIERYSWFGAMKDLQGVDRDNALVDNDGNISALGRQYANVTGDGPVRNGGSRNAIGRCWRSGVIVLGLSVVLATDLWLYFL